MTSLLERLRRLGYTDPTCSDLDPQTLRFDVANVANEVRCPDCGGSVVALPLTAGRRTYVIVAVCGRCGWQEEY